MIKFDWCCIESAAPNRRPPVRCFGDWDGILFFVPWYVGPGTVLLGAGGDCGGCGIPLLPIVRAFFRC